MVGQGIVVQQPLRHGLSALPELLPGKGSRYWMTARSGDIEDRPTQFLVGTETVGRREAPAIAFVIDEEECFVPSVVTLRNPHRATEAATSVNTL